MLDKTLFLLLFSLIYSQIVNLTVFQLTAEHNITVDKSSGLICYELHNDIQVNKDFYLEFNCKEGGKNIDKTIFYNLTELSCKDLKNLTIDLDNAKSDFMHSHSEPYIPAEGSGFFYEYNIIKSEEKQKFMLILFRDFTGQNFKVWYTPISLKKVKRIFIIIIIVIAVILLSILVGVPICICLCCRRNRTKSPDLESPAKNVPAYPLVPLS